jgi:dynein intermediate chain
MSEKDRKAEIERRKKRLEELRQTRKEGRNKEPVYTKGLESSSLTHRENVDEFVNQILATSPIPSSVSPTPAINPSDSIVINDNTIKNSGIMENSVISSTPVKKSSKLTIDQLLPVNIKPKIIEVYEKHTQTIVDENEKTEIYQEEDDDNLQPNTLSHKKTEYDDKKSEVNVAVREELSYIAPHGTLSEDNKKMILQSEDFSMFIERSSIVMERALAETSDILFDLALSREVGGDKDVLSTINIVRKKQFSDERWTKGRMISSIAWSPHHTGIVLASYYQLDKTTSDPDGVVLMWDLKFVKDTPDYVFNCHSSVMSVTFSKFHPHFVIGGTYSGQIVLWDIRSGKRTPVQRSLLSTSAHTHPIYCLEVVGSLNAHNLISVSTDGRLCCWNLDNLSQPQVILKYLFVIIIVSRIMQIFRIVILVLLLLHHCHSQKMKLTSLW